MLPTLGLTKYKNVDLQQDRKNPFTVQAETEKLLVVRERQREFKDFNKLEKESLRVYEKEKSSRPTRRGVIREIRNIRSRHGHSMSAQFDGGPGPLAIVSQDEAPQKQKLNIFEQKDTAAIKREQFAKLGYLPEKNALVPVTSNLATFHTKQDDVDALDQKSQGSTALEPLFQKPKAIDYLNKGRDQGQKETVKDFINLSR